MFQRDDMTNLSDVEDYGMSHVINHESSAQMVSIQLTN